MSLWNIFAITFILGLGGAISPGALLTYTIFHALQRGKKAYIPGLLISLGHAFIEILLILILLLGLAPLLNNSTILTGIGIVGGLILSIIGLLLLLQIIQQKVSTDFLKDASNNASNSEEISKNESSPQSSNNSKSPFLGGILFLMSNPYWWLWWLTVGLGILLENDVSFAQPSTVFIFIIGKELGAILWYTGISIALGFSRNFLNKRVYLGILLICAVFMLGYGFFLVLTTIFSL